MPLLRVFNGSLQSLDLGPVDEAVRTFGRAERQQPPAPDLVQRAIAFADLGQGPPREDQPDASLFLVIPKLRIQTS